MSARPHGITRLQLCRENSSTLHEDQCTFMIISRSFLLRMRNASERSCGGNQYTHLMFNSFISPRKSCSLWDNVQNYCTVGQATDDNMAHAYCMMVNYGYRYTLRIGKRYYPSTAKMVRTTHLNVEYVRIWNVFSYYLYFCSAVICYIHLRYKLCKV